MQPTICTRCKKNVAVVFVTKIEEGNTVSEGFCLKCAKEMGLKPIDDMIKRMGLSEEELETLSTEMMDAFQGMEGLMTADHTQDEDDDEEESDSQTATFPFLNKLFGNRQDNMPAPAEPKKDGEKQEKHDRSGGKKNKRKFLDTYCLNLTQKA